MSAEKIMLYPMKNHVLIITNFGCITNEFVGGRI